MSMDLCTDSMQNDVLYLEGKGTDTSIHINASCSMK